MNPNLTYQEDLDMHVLQSLHHQLLQRINDTPYYFYVPIQKHTYSCSLTYLCDGIELLVFANDHDFCRSLCYSIDNEPDFLFTNAFSLVFPYAKEEMCPHMLVYASGCLPTQPMPHQIKRLHQILFFLHTHLQYHKQLPHTKDVLSLSFLAYPPSSCTSSVHLDIHLLATADTYQEEIPICMSPYHDIAPQAYAFLFDVFQQYGIPFRMHIHNVNLAHMLLPFLAQLHITTTKLDEPVFIDIC